MTSYAHNGDVTIAHERLGPPDGEPLLLVLSPGTQLVAWPDGFCQDLVDRGFTVARFDSRDCGLSTRFDDAHTPSRLKLITNPSPTALFRRADHHHGTGSDRLRQRSARYTLDDLADDAVAVLDADVPRLVVVRVSRQDHPAAHCRPQGIDRVGHDFPSVPARAGIERNEGARPARDTGQCAGA